MPRSIHRYCNFCERRSSAQLRGVPLGMSGPADTNPASHDRRRAKRRFSRAPSGAPVPAAPLQFSGASRRTEKWLAKNQHTTPSHLRLLRHIRLHVRNCPRSLAAAFWALVTTKLLVPCQLFPSHGSWILTQDAAGYDRFSFRQHYGRPQWVKSIPYWNRYQSSKTGKIPQQNVGQDSTPSPSAQTTSFRQRNR